MSRIGVVFREPTPWGAQQLACHHRVLYPWALARGVSRAKSRAISLIELSRVIVTMGKHDDDNHDTENSLVGQVNASYVTLKDGVKQQEQHCCWKCGEDEEDMDIGIGIDIGCVGSEEPISAVEGGNQGLEWTLGEMEKSGWWR
ncbi:hypothetical protein CBR_g23111 [Chara braunii]|uniref:Uncharacterized protein n=1 Tax=Chara braunii TaxID=69332 RepID=A0A388L3M7_CHABU|nr:hypothetical protein CBR_g23111 [Chara braunii]|eukprot:GBG76897.1 hypothetical protein CBR_g23111 [Chara braunii]